MLLTEAVVSHTLGLRYEDLPGSVVGAVKRTILDTLAVTIAGSSAEGIGPLVELIHAWGGRKESAIRVYGGKVPAPMAALANATMARALDLDDVHEKAVMHSSATIVPSAYVISEYSKSIRDTAINGKDFILAVALGSDLLCRLRLAGPGAPNEGGWASETPGALAVAAMGGRLLGFDEEKVLHALGIAYAQCSGNIQAITEGALTVRLQQGLSAMSGILSLMLADKGFTGVKKVFEGKHGYYALYMKGKYTPEALTEELGARFEVTNISTKFYPSCKYTHTAIYGALQLAKMHAIKPEEIEKITVTTTSYGYNVCGGERKIVPQTVPDAQFSFYYTVAAALVHGRVFIDDFTEEAIRNERVLSVARKVEVIEDPQKQKSESVLSPIDIEIVTKDGSRYKKSVDLVKGHPDSPIDFGDLAEKLTDCVPFSARDLPNMDTSAFIDCIKHLEESDDVTETLNYLN